MARPPATSSGGPAKRRLSPDLISAPWDHCPTLRLERAVSCIDPVIPFTHSRPAKSRAVIFSEDDTRNRLRSGAYRTCFAEKASGKRPSGSAGIECVDGINAARLHQQFRAVQLLEYHRSVIETADQHGRTTGKYHAVQNRWRGLKGAGRPGSRVYHTFMISFSFASISASTFLL